MGKILLIFLVIIYCSSGFVYPKEDSQLYSQAVEAAKAGQIELAFMYFRTFLKEHPQGKLSIKALFAMGECYYLFNAYSDAARTFNSFIKKYPESKVKLFAIAYLFKIAHIEGKQDLIEGLKKELLTIEQVSLLFRNYKKISYTSPLLRKYKALYFIDKIEFYIDEEPFTEIYF